MRTVLAGARRAALADTTGVAQVGCATASTGLQVSRGPARPVDLHASWPLRREAWWRR